MDRQPPRPRPRLPSYTDDPAPTMFDEWNRDRGDGITLRATRRMLDEHIDETQRAHIDMIARLTRLEADKERNAEDRAMGTGRFVVVPDRQATALTNKPKPLKPWYSQEPFLTVLKYLLFALAVLFVREVSLRLGVAPPIPPTVSHP